MILYKYLAWENSCTQRNIKNNTWWFNTPIGFNDPYDINPSFEMDEEEREDLKKLQIPEQILDSLSIEQILTLARSGDRSRVYNSRYGIYCFSCKNDDILMWSHYGDQHRGICLGFNVPQEDLQLKDASEQNIDRNGNFTFKLFPIKYESVRPKFIFSKKFTNKDVNKMIEDLLQVKSDKWSYEKEQRIMIRSEKEGIFPCELHYPSEYLTEVIIGANSNIRNFFNIINFIKDNSLQVKFFLATLDKHEYKLNIIPLSLNQLEQAETNYKELIAYDVDEIKEYWKNREKYIEFLLRDDSEIRKAWKNGINKLTTYSIWEYVPSFFNKNIKETLYLKKSRIDTSIVDVIILKDLIADNIENGISCKEISCNIN